jgi:hypothetical protein
MDYIHDEEIKEGEVGNDRATNILQLILTDEN